MHPRLFVITAQRAPLAVILRRGPKRWAHLILWNTDKDTFEHGAWFKGRIYEDRCGLSPDGALFVYFALQNSRWRTSYQGVWTAVSRPPWLHALALWPEGTTYGGGGCFVGDRELVLRNWRVSPKAHPEHQPNGLTLSTGPCPHASSDDSVGGADWSGRDHSGRRVFAREGKLFRRSDAGDVELADFNDLTPDPQPPPPWATRPL